MRFHQGVVLSRTPHRLHVGLRNFHSGEPPQHSAGRLDFGPALVRLSAEERATREARVLAAIAPPVQPFRRDAIERELDAVAEHRVATQGQKPKPRPFRGSFPNPRPGKGARAKARREAIRRVLQEQLQERLVEDRVPLERPRYERLHDEAVPRFGRRKA